MATKKFTLIPANTFKELQLDAGVFLSEFDPTAGTITKDKIICATTGGITVSLTPTFSDLGDDVDNCPANMMELKNLDSWEAKMSFTALSITPETIRLSLGAADVTTATGEIVPRRDLDATKDFESYWWVGDRSDGGFVAVQIMNALSTGGFSLKTTKAGKGNVSVELTGHVSIDAQDVVPMKFYVSEA